MDLSNLRRFFNILLTAMGIFVLIFIIYAIFVASRIAQRKDKQEIKTDYAGERLSPTSTISQ